MTAPAWALWHLGGLHPFEQLLVLVLAFGPFVVLGLVVAAQRRRAIAAEQADRRAADDAGPGEASGPGTPGPRGSPPSAP